jgi:hypothetical protein
MLPVAPGACAIAAPSHSQAGSTPSPARIVGAMSKFVTSPALRVVGLVSKPAPYDQPAMATGANPDSEEGETRK